MAEIKGALLNAWLDFLKESYGDSAVSQAVQSIKPADRQMLSAPFLDSSWYPYDTLHALRRLTQPLATSPDANLAIAIGRHMADHVFSGVYRSFLTDEPAKQVEKFEWIQEFFFRQTRTLETEVTSSHTSLVRYRYDQDARPTRGICASLLGFWSRTLELAGAGNLKAQHSKCVAEGGDCCEFLFEWE